MAGVVPMNERESSANFLPLPIPDDRSERMVLVAMRRPMSWIVSRSMA